MNPGQFCNKRVFRSVEGISASLETPFISFLHVFCMSKHCIDTTYFGSCVVEQVRHSSLAVARTLRGLAVAGTLRVFQLYLKTK